ncbi:hypothetical protein DYH09_35510 [bacterium CPR1]|nr:hypothetical protein [bacterium CPR1]
MLERLAPTLEGDVFLELLEELGEKPPEFTLSCRLDEKPDEVAQRFRAWLGMTLEQQHAWTNEDFPALVGTANLVCKLGCDLETRQSAAMPVITDSLEI